MQRIAHPQLRVTNKSGTNFFKLEETGDELEADMEGMLLQESTNFFNVVEGVGFLAVQKE